MILQPHHMSDDPKDHRRYAIHKENTEGSPGSMKRGQSQEAKMDMGNILTNAFQIATIVVSITFMYGVQRFMSEPIEGDEAKRAIMEQARTLRREARQRSLEILKASSELDFPLGTASSSTGKDEQAKGASATRKKLSRREELRVSDLSQRRVAAGGETQGDWGTAGSCG